MRGILETALGSALQFFLNRQNFLITIGNPSMSLRKSVQSLTISSSEKLWGKEMGW
jgi:hypothetical protein